MAENNDVASYVEAGEMPTGAGEGDLSNLSQIYPCFSSYCNAIRTEWPTTDVYFVTSMMAGNNIVSGITGTMMYDFWQDMKKICCYYNIRVIDLSQIAGFDTRISGGSNPYMFDTFHPNEAGYRKMGPAFNHEICKYY